LDEERANAVCVIGTGIRNDLFGDRNGRPDHCAAGEIIFINDQPFTNVVCLNITKGNRNENAASRPRNNPNPRGGPGTGPGFGRGNWAFARKNQNDLHPV
jgi:hypothetical protein